MNETKTSKHHKFTLAIYGKPELGEYTITSRGDYWHQAFGKACLKLEAELGLDYGCGIKNIREWPPVDLINPHEDYIGRFESYDYGKKDQREKIEAMLQDGILDKYVISFDQTAEFADLRLLGHVAAASQAESSVD